MTTGRTGSGGMAFYGPPLKEGATGNGGPLLAAPVFGNVEQGTLLHDRHPFLIFGLPLPPYLGWATALPKGAKRGKVALRKLQPFNRLQKYLCQVFLVRSTRKLFRCQIFLGRRCLARIWRNL